MVTCYMGDNTDNNGVTFMFRILITDRHAASVLSS